MMNSKVFNIVNIILAKVFIVVQIFVFDTLFPFVLMALTDPMPASFKSCSLEAFQVKSWLDEGQCDYNPEENDVNGIFLPVFKGKLEDLKTPKLLSVTRISHPHTQTHIIHTHTLTHWLKHKHKYTPTHVFVSVHIYVFCVCDCVCVCLCVSVSV